MAGSGGNALVARCVVLSQRRKTDGGDRYCGERIVKAPLLVAGQQREHNNGTPRNVGFKTLPFGKAAARKV